MDFYVSSKRPGAIISNAYTKIGHLLFMLKKSKGGTPPKFNGDGLLIHNFIRQEMKRIYHEKRIPVYLDAVAKSALQEGINNYHKLNLDNVQILQIGKNLFVLPWLGDQAINTITILLCKHFCCV